MPLHSATRVLGISAPHNGAVCLLKDDEIVVAVQEERLSRFRRHRIYGAKPSCALGYCLDYAGITLDDLKPRRYVSTGACARRETRRR